MKSIKKIEFSAELVLERSCTPDLESIGEHKCSMELFLNSDSQGFIEWIYEDEEGYEDAEHIGVWFQGKELVDYDGVFSLPEEAIQLLEECGYNADYAKV